MLSAGMAGRALGWRAVGKITGRSLCHSKLQSGFRGRPCGGNRRAKFCRLEARNPAFGDSTWNRRQQGAGFSDDAVLELRVAYERRALHRMAALVLVDTCAWRIADSWGNGNSPHTGTNYSILVPSVRAMYSLSLSLSRRKCSSHIK